MPYWDYLHFRNYDENGPKHFGDARQKAEDILSRDDAVDALESLIEEFNGLYRFYADISHAGGIIPIHMRHNQNTNIFTEELEFVMSQLKIMAKEHIETWTAQMEAACTTVDIENYYKRHKCCPSCKSDSVKKVNLGYLSPFRDTNQARCECGWSGVVDDLARPEPRLNAGDVVFGPDGTKMTVSKLEGELAYCTWFVESTVHHGKFKADSLTPVESIPVLLDRIAKSEAGDFQVGPQ